MKAVINSGDVDGADEDTLPEILRKFAAEEDLPDETSVRSADELFRTLDAEEAFGGPCIVGPTERLRRARLNNVLRFDRLVDPRWRRL